MGKRFQILGGAVLVLALGWGGGLTIGGEPAPAATQNAIWLDATTLFQVGDDVIAVKAGAYRVRRHGDSSIRLLPLAGGRLRIMPAHEVEVPDGLAGAMCLTDAKTRTVHVVLRLEDGRGLRILGVALGDRTRGEFPTFRKPIRIKVPLPTSYPKADFVVSSLVIRDWVRGTTGRVEGYEMGVTVTNVGAVTAQLGAIRYQVFDAQGTQIHEVSEPVSSTLRAGQSLITSSVVTADGIGPVRYVATVQAAPGVSEFKLSNNSRDEVIERYREGWLSFTHPAEGTSMFEGAQCRVTWTTTGPVPDTMRLGLKTSPDQIPLMVLSSSVPVRDGQFTFEMPGGLAGGTYLVMAEAPYFMPKVTRSFGVRAVELLPTFPPNQDVLCGEDLTLRWNFDAPPEDAFALRILLEDAGGSLAVRTLADGVPVTHRTWTWTSPENAPEAQYGVPDEEGRFPPKRIVLKVGDHVAATSPVFRLKRPMLDLMKSYGAASVSSLQIGQQSVVRFVLLDERRRPMEGVEVRIEVAFEPGAPLTDLPFEAEPLAETQTVSSLTSDASGAVELAVTADVGGPGIIWVAAVVGDLALPTFGLTVSCHSSTWTVHRPGEGATVTAGQPLEVAWEAQSPLTSRCRLWLCESSSGQPVLDLGSHESSLPEVSLNLSSSIEPGEYRVHVFDARGYTTDRSAAFRIEAP